MAAPSVTSSTAEAKVAMPSGKLWMPMASAVSSPMRMSFVLRGRASISSTLCASCGFSTEGTRRAMMPMSRMPAKKAATVTAPPARGPHSAASVALACWKSSTNET